MLEGAKSIGAGAATIASAGAAVGIGIFSSLIHSVARNPSLSKQSFGYVLPFLLFMDRIHVGASSSKNNAPPDPADDGKGRGHNTIYWALYVRALDHLRSEMKKKKGRPVSHVKARKILALLGGDCIDGLTEITADLVAQEDSPSLKKACRILDDIKMKNVLDSELDKYHFVDQQSDENEIP
nr:ATP synthase F0 subunit c [Coptis chinensis]